MSLTFEIKSFAFGGVAPYGWKPHLGQWDGRIFGHEFTMVATVKLKSSKDWFNKPFTVATLPSLTWLEREFWWEGDGAGHWEYKGTTDKGDLYQSSPGSPTWGGFRQETDYLNYSWVSFPGCDVKSDMQATLFSLAQRATLTGAKSVLTALESQSAYRDAKQLSETAGRRAEGRQRLWVTIAERFAEKSQALVVAALDRPGMAKGGGNGQSGGGFVSKTTSTTRRRVLQFDLGLVGQPGRFTATQILETTNGEPTISKFLIPARPDDWCLAIPEKYLAYWRAQLDPTNGWNHTTTFEPESEVDAWLAAPVAPTAPTVPTAPTIPTAPWVAGSVPRHWVAAAPRTGP